MTYKETPTTPEPLEFLEGLEVESRRLFTMQFNIGDLPKLHESFATCIKQIKKLSENVPLATSKDSLDELLSAIGDYFYWIDKTARSGYVQRDFLQSVYMAHISEQVDFMYQTLQEIGLERIMEESFIILGIEEIGTRYNRDGFAKILEDKFEPQNFLYEEDPNFSRKKTLRNKSEFPGTDECETTLEELRGMLFGQKKPLKTAPVEQQNQFPSVEPSSMDPPKPQSTPAQTSRTIRNLTYAAITLVGFTGSSALAYYKTKVPTEKPYDNTPTLVQSAETPSPNLIEAPLRN